MGEALSDRGVEAVVHQVCGGPGPAGSTSFPDPSGFDLVVLYGSRWSVYDDRVAHWVQPELQFIHDADRAGVPVLGLCFGGQILSTALGGSVAPTLHPEIGWFEVEPAAPAIEPGPWLQWHFDAFSVPEGARELARSVAGPQAFRLRANLGLQFHPEADRSVLEAWLTDDLDQLEEAGLDAEALLSGADRHLGAARGRARRLVAGVLRGPS